MARKVGGMMSWMAYSFCGRLILRTAGGRGCCSCLEKERRESVEGDIPLVKADP